MELKLELKLQDVSVYKMHFNLFYSHFLDISTSKGFEDVIEQIYTFLTLLNELKRETRWVTVSEN